METCQPRDKARILDAETTIAGRQAIHTYMRSDRFVACLVRVSFVVRPALVDIFWLRCGVEIEWRQHLEASEVEAVLQISAPTEVQPLRHLETSAPRSRTADSNDGVGTDVMEAGCMSSACVYCTGRTWLLWLSSPWDQETMTFLPLRPRLWPRL